MSVAAHRTNEILMRLFKYYKKDDYYPRLKMILIKLVQLFFFKENYLYFKCYFKIIMKGNTVLSHGRHHATNIHYLN